MVQPGDVGGQSLEQVGVGECTKHLRAGNDLVVYHAADGAHGKATIVQFLRLHVGDVLGALALEALGTVEGGLELTHLAVSVCVHILHGHLAIVVDPLQNANSQKDLGNRIERVVAMKHREKGIDGVLGLVQRTGEVNAHLLGQKTNHGQHGHTPVLDLRLTQPLGVIDLGKSDGVEIGISL